MTDRYKNIPPNIRNGIASLKNALLALAPEEKQTILQNIEQGEAPSQSLAGIWEAVREAMKLDLPEVHAEIDAALKSPCTLIAPTDAQMMADFAQKQLSMFSKLEQGTKARIVAAIRNKDSREALIPAERDIWGMLLVILTFPDDYTERVAEAFNITTAEVETLKAETLKAKVIPLDDETAYLPGLEPTEAERAAMPVLFNPAKYRLGDKYNLPSSKVVQKLLELVDSRTIGFKVAQPSKSEKATITKVTLGTPTGVTTTTKLTYYDNLVMAAFGNLSEDNGRQKFYTTTASVYKRMRGNKDAKPSAATLKKVNDSILKLASTWVEIDFADQLKLTGGKGEGHLQSMALQVTGIKLKQSANGPSYDGWIVNCAPVIYEYSKMVKQVSTIDSKLLDVSTINNTPEVMTEIFYLLQQIERMKHNHKTSEKITYDALFKATGDTLPMENSGSGRTTRTMRLKAIKAILDSFVKKGYIAKYTEEKQTRRIYAVTIQLPTTEAIPRGGKWRRRPPEKS